MTEVGEGEPVHASAQLLCDELIAWFGVKTYNLVFPHSNKSYVAGALLRGAMDHFNAICYLAKAGAHTSAFALLRVEWQSLINGLWIHLICPEEQAPKSGLGNWKSQD